MKRRWRTQTQATSCIRTTGLFQLAMAVLQTHLAQAIVVEMSKAFLQGPFSLQAR